MKQLKIAAMAFTAVAVMTACGGGEEEADAAADALIQEMNDAIDEVAEAATYNVDATVSKVMWKGEMLGVYSHEGTINIKEGAITTEGGAVTGGDIVIDMGTITPTDENYNPDEQKTPENLVGHLSSPEFFSTGDHPTATFKVKSMSDAGIVGDLTIKGKTNEETVVVSDWKESEGTFSATGSLTFNRQNYDVSYSPGKDMVLSDDIVLNFELTANK